MSLGKSDPPPPPDYTGAAVATAAGNADAARIAAKANRVNQYTPYGSLIFQSGVDGDQDKWQSTVNLSPTGQALLDSQNRISLGLGSLGERGLGYVQNTLSQPFNWGAVPQGGLRMDENRVQPTINARDSEQATNLILQRLEPSIERDRSAMAQRLANQGIGVGTQAYDEALGAQGRQTNDLRTQAALQGLNVANMAFGQNMGAAQQAQSAAAFNEARRQQAIQEQSFARNEPLNMLNAVRSGAQVQNPAFTSVPMQAAVPGPDYLGAAQAAYGNQLAGFNAGQAQEAGLMNGIFGLGSAALMGGFNPFGMGAAAAGPAAGYFGGIRGSLPQFRYGLG